MTDCLFCKIARGEIKGEIVYENDRTLAFLDIHPRSPGHTVVINKHHNENLLDLPEKEVAPLFLATKKVAQKLARVLRPDGFTFGVNHGAVSGQTVPHLHVHIMPRFLGDGGGSVHSVVSNPPREPLQDIGRRLREAQ